MNQLTKKQGAPLNHHANTCIIIEVLGKNLRERTLSIFFHTDGQWNNCNHAFQQAEFINAYATQVAKNDVNAIGYKSTAYKVKWSDDGKYALKKIAAWSPVHIKKEVVCN